MVKDFDEAILGTEQGRGRFGTPEKLESRGTLDGLNEIADLLRDWLPPRLRCEPGGNCFRWNAPHFIAARACPRYDGRGFPPMGPVVQLVRTRRS